MRILKEKTSALIIDFQERLFPVIFENDKIEKNTQILIEGLKALEIPIIVTEQYKKGLGETITPLSNLLQEATFVDKVTFSCCDESHFMEKIDSNRNFVIIAGVEAHICLLQTAIDLKGKGFQPVVISDCIGSRTAENKQVAITRLIQEGVLISSTESILFELCRAAGNDTFKTISKLIK